MTTTHGTCARSARPHRPSLSPIEARPDQYAKPFREPPDVPGSSMPDLRRRDARRFAESIAMRAAWLRTDEQVLIRSIYQDGRSITEIAALAGVSVRTLRRQVRRILRRVSSPAFAYVAVHQERWPTTMRRVGQACVLQGHAVRTAAGRLRLSVYTVRRYRDMILTMSEADRHTPGDSAGATPPPEFSL